MIRRWGSCLVLDVPILATAPTPRTLDVASKSALQPGVQSYTLCPLALDVRAPRTLMHNFALGPCRVAVEVVLRNNAQPGAQPLTFDIVLMDKPVEEAHSVSHLHAVQWYVGVGGACRTCVVVVGFAFDAHPPAVVSVLKCC